MIMSYCKNTANLGSKIAALTLLYLVHTKAEIPTDAGQTCKQLDPDSFSSFIAEHKVALLQVYSDAQILEQEVPLAIKRMDLDVGYAALDASQAANKDLVSKLDRSDENANDFFVFRNGLPHNKLPGLVAGLSQHAVEEQLVFLAMELTALADTEAIVGSEADPYPLWSVHKRTDRFSEIFVAEDFDALMAEKAGNEVTIVQFFSRSCKYCQLFSYEWHKIGQTFGPLPSVSLVRVDGNTVQNQELLKRYGVTGFPTIKIFIGGTYEETYRGERQAEAFEEYATQFIETARVRARNPDGSVNMQRQLPLLLKNLEGLYSSGALTEEQYLERFRRLQKINAVTE